MGRFRNIIIGLFSSVLAFTAFTSANAQCSICTRTAQQQGKEAAEDLNGGIIYLMILPLAIGGVIGYRWWLTEKKITNEES